MSKRYSKNLSNNVGKYNQGLQTTKKNVNNHALNKKEIPILNIYREHYKNRHNESKQKEEYGEDRKEYWNKMDKNEKWADVVFLQVTAWYP